MNYTKNNWAKEDIAAFQESLIALAGTEAQREWEKKIINTELPCLAIKSKEVDNIVKQISKGNFIEFIDLWIWEYHTNTSIIGSLIRKIKDFELMREYLLKYSEKIDNWASCDTLRFALNRNNKPDYFSLSKEFIKGEKTFTRRISLSILFAFIDDDEYIYQIFDILNSLNNETEYYVNMMAAWLTAECFVKQRDKTLEFLKTHNLNRFTINKAVQKCRDSYRVSAADKESLLVYKVK